jgi:hypothetical protein
VITAQSLPYNPTSILLSPADLDTAYVFLPSLNSGTTQQLLSLNVSSTVSVSNLSLEVVTSSLPFRTDDSTAFIPSISTSGQISVYAGSCSTQTSAQLWTFTGTSTNTTNGGTWRNDTTATASRVASAVLPGANYLSRAFSFSDHAHGNISDTNIYIFGGMCPNQSTEASTWQLSAAYSNTMLRFAPDSSTSYTLDFTSSRGPPIAEAGFTITGLTPTYFNNSNPVTQQRNFVLLGGHTQTAFINMSQVAIYSLPEETWSFVTVDAPSTMTPNTDLVVKSAAVNVDSRSGHSAVLTEDGTKIILFGGWVGDTSQAASPQLVILELGTGFGGNGDWFWSTPTNQPSGTGLYGHGAVLLPGNVMMVLGGYSISDSSTSKRDSAPAAQAMFFNATSLSWISNYTNPSYTAKIADNLAEALASAKSKAKSRRIALGVGLGLGLTTIVILLAIFCCYKRRLKKRCRDDRDRRIQSLGSGPALFHTPSREMGEQKGGFPWSYSGWNRAATQQDDDQDRYEDLNAGVHGFGKNVPSPPRQITRKPLHSRGARGRYQPAPSNFDFNTGGNLGRAASLGTAGPIHPIYEADEDDRVSNTSENGIGIAMGEPPLAAASENRKRHSDPFKDTNMIPPSPSHREDSESPARSREREIQEWVSDWAAADALISSQARAHSAAGRVSPSRRAQLIAASNVSSVSGEEDSGRTASNLSDQSVAVSAMTLSRSGSSSQGRSRSNSLRGFITNAMNPFTTTILSNTVVSTNSLVFDSGTKAPGSSGSSSSFTTARTSFKVLQAEAEILLPRPEEGWRNDEFSPTRLTTVPGSPSKSKPLASRGWIGSLRRAIGRESGSPSYNASPAATCGGRTPSPLRIDYSETIQPRRTVSAGATLWRRKQGKVDWEDSEDAGCGTPSGAQRSNTFTEYMSSTPLTDDDDDDDEWDIERAVQNRVVQVMFTVPKEKLRVVNHDFTDEDKSDVGSLKSKRGSEKSRKDVPGIEPIDVKGKGKEVVAEKKGRGRVQDIVEKIEGMTTPERGSPDRS